MGSRVPDLIGKPLKLTPNFSLWELSKSQTAIRLGLDNVPNQQAQENLKKLSVNILQPVRDHFKIPFSPSSCFRSKFLNRAIGSSDSSSHILGQAADFEIPQISNPTLAMWIKDNLVFDQLILEYFEAEKGENSGWVHVSYKAGNNRNEILTLNNRGVFPGLYI